MAIGHLLEAKNAFIVKNSLKIEKKSPRILDRKIPPTSPILNPSTPGESRDNLPAGVLRFRDPTSPFRGPKIG